MIRDVHFGFLVLLAMAGAIGFRVLPHFSDQGKEKSVATAANERSRSEGAKTDAPVLALPGLDEPAAETVKSAPPAKAESQPIADQDSKAKKGVLTTIFPQGYKDRKKAEESRSESPSPEPVLEPPAATPPADAKEQGKDSKPKGVDNGPVLLIDKNAGKEDSKNDVAADADDPPKNPSRKEKEDGPVLALPSDDVVTEFVPFVEKEEVKKKPADSKMDEKSNADADPDPSASKDRSSSKGSKVALEKETDKDAILPLPNPDREEREPVASRTPSPRPWPRDKVIESEGRSNSEKNASGAEGKDSEDRVKGDKVPTVLSYDVRPEGSDAGPPIVKTGRGPVHPFFQRYLDRKTYYVREGDDLRRIAEHLYQDESMVSKLFEANKHQLKRPEDLRPGMLLRLP
ncbi:MAG: hypothetical protein U1D30_10240 [Planctomycetota bacterium]